jgi:hypothetical protein
LVRPHPPDRFARCSGRRDHPRASGFSRRPSGRQRSTGSVSSRSWVAIARSLLDWLRAVDRRLVHAARRAVRPDYEAALRRYLENQDREWLIDQLVRLSLDPRSRAERDAGNEAADDAAARSARQERLRAIDLDEDRLRSFVEGYRGHDRDRLVDEGCLHPEAPEPGTEPVADEHRTEAGAALLLEA